MHKTQPNWRVLKYIIVEPSPLMSLMTCQSLPPSSASSIMIMSQNTDLAGQQSLRVKLLCALEYEVIPHFHEEMTSILVCLY